jgi:hypothetical protein
MTSSSVYVKACIQNKGRAGGRAQAVEHLHSKDEVLSSRSSTTKIRAGDEKG